MSDDECDFDETLRNMLATPPVARATSRRISGADEITSSEDDDAASDEHR
jgi:hypothetical protein